MRLSALGDLFLLLPAVQSLCEALPNTSITWLVERRFLPVVQHLANVLTLYPVDGPRSITEYRRIRHDFRQQKFSVLLAMQAKLRSNLIYPLLKAERKIGFDSRRARDGQSLFINEQIAQADEHLADGFFAFIRQLGVTHEAKQWAPPLQAAALAWRQQQLGSSPYLVFNPSASKAERDWPKARQLEFLRRLSEISWQGRVVITGSDAAHAAELAASIPNGFNLSGQTNLPQLFALLAGAQAVITPDSGPVHIARAYDVPVVGLYAVARSALSGPWRQSQYCVDVYDEAVRGLLKRDPTTMDWHARVHDPRAMQLITVDAVLAQTQRALAKVA